MVVFIAERASSGMAVSIGAHILSQTMHPVLPLSSVQHHMTHISDTGCSMRSGGMEPGRLGGQ